MKSLVLTLLLLSCSAHAVSLNTSGSLVEEVLATGPTPKTWDWRHDTLVLDLGYTVINEKNSFQSFSSSVGISRPLNESWLMRLALRQVKTEATPSSELLGLTPFSQAGLPSRKELLLGVGYTLLDGRSAAPWSPRITDLGHALYLLGGLQYHLYENKDPEPLSGMRALYPTLAAEGGFLLKIYLPQNLSLSLEWTLSQALDQDDSDLQTWTRFGGGISWSFGR